LTIAVSHVNLAALENPRLADGRHAVTDPSADSEKRALSLTTTSRKSWPTESVMSLGPAGARFEFDGLLYSG